MGDIASRPLTVIAAFGLVAAACTPTVKVQAPDKPIEIHMKLEITQEVRIKLDKEVEDLIGSRDDIF